MKKKHKFLKTFSFTSLALLMGIAGTMAFAPLGASAQGGALANASETVETTTEQGLISTHENDPTLYTTESGLDIKFGLATPNIETSLSTGNLKGFPYFTTTSGSTTYTWVIIGQAEDKPLGASKPASFLFSNWTSLSEYFINKNYFSNNILDTTTPAGTAINSVSPSKSYVIDSTNFGNLTTNSEIPSGCVLVLANNIVATGVFNTVYYYGSSNEKPQMYTGNVQIRVAMNGYWSNKSFGIAGLEIVSVPLSSYAHYWNGSVSKDYLYTEDAYIFPMGASTYGGTNFAWNSYLETNEMKLTSIQWLRGLCGIEYGTFDYNLGSWSGRAIDTSGTSFLTPVAKSHGYRPAFCLKL